MPTPQTANHMSNITYAIAKKGFEPNNVEDLVIPTLRLDKDGVIETVNIVKSTRDLTDLNVTMIGSGNQYDDYIKKYGKITDETEDQS